MSDANDRRGLVVGEFGVTFVTADNGQPMVLGRDVRGGFSAYNDSERDALDGRRLDHRMIIWNTTTNEYQYLATEPNADGTFPDTVTWTALQFAGGSIDSDDSDARHNHTSAIVTGRGLGFNRTDSELEITANQVAVFRSNSDRNADTRLWSRGDVAMSEGLEYFTDNGGVDNSGWASSISNVNPRHVVLFGMTQAQFNTIVASGVLASTTEGANRRNIVSTITGYTAGQIPGENLQFASGQAILEIDEDIAVNPPGINLNYLTERAGINGGIYFFLPDDDTRGPTVSTNWQRALVDQETEIQVRNDFTNADSELRSDLDTEILNRIASDDSDAAAIRVIRADLATEVTDRTNADAELQRQLDKQNTRDTDIETMYQAADTALGARIDSENIALDEHVAILQGEIDSEIRRIHGRVNNVTEVGYGLIFNHTDSELSVDSERLDSDFRLASLNLQGYVDVPVVTDLDTERIVISGNLNTAAPVTNSNTTGRGRYPADVSFSGGLQFSGVVAESLIDINGTYIRDPKSRKILQITDDRGQGAFFPGGNNPNPGTGATVKATDSEEFFSYWQPGGGGLDEGLSIVATNDLGYISHNSTDRRDSDLPLNWRIVRGRWYDDTQFNPGQNFSGVPNGGSATDSPICTFNLFGDSDAKQAIPLGALIDSELFDPRYVGSPSAGSTQYAVGGGSAVYAPRNTSQEFFRTIFDENHGATREYVDSRLTEQGIQNLIGNTETLVTYSQDLASFPRPGPFVDAGEAGDRGHELGPNTFLLKSTAYASRPGRYPSSEAASSVRYFPNDIGPGENLGDARELWVRGSTDIFRNVLGKIVEDSVILFSDSDGSRKFYWTVQSAVQQSFNENLYVITPKAVKYATGTLDTDSTYQVYLKPNADDLVPGDRIVPESIQPLALHLDSGQSLQDGYGVTVRRSGDTFLFGIEQNTGGGSSGGTDTAGVNAIVNTLELERVDSDSDYLRLYGNTAEATPAVTGTRGQVSVQFASRLSNNSTDTEMYTLVTPQGDSESFTVGTRSETSEAGRRANALLAYLNDNAVGNSLVFGDASLAGETVTWTWQQTGVVDSDFLRSSNVPSTLFTNRIITDGTNDIPATFRRGLISQAVLPDVNVNVREGTGMVAGITGPLDGSTAVVITHGADSDHFQLQPNPTKGVRWDLNDQDVTLTVDYQLASGNAVNRFAGTSGGLVPAPGTKDSEEYFLSGAGTWVGVTHHQNSVFNDSESGLVPAPGRGAVTGTQFLADDGLWKNPHEFIDTDDIARALDFDVEYDAPNRVLEFDANYQIPAVPGTDGQRAWMILRFTNDPTTNSAGNRPLESSATLLLRAPDGNGNYSDFNVHWSNADIPPGHGDEGQNDVATIFAQAIGQNYQAQGEVDDIGQGGDNGFTFRMAHEGTVDTDSTSDNRFIVEFDSHFYNVEAAYAVPGVDRGYPANAPATGALHTNGTPARDSERVFDTVVLPLFDSDNAGLVPPSTAHDSELYLAGDGTWNTVPRSRIVFNDAEVDVYSDLFRIDYLPDSDELVFSAQSDIVDSETRVESAGVTTFVPPSGNLFITDTHLVLGPLYRIDIPANLFNNNTAYTGTFSDFYLSNDGRHTIIDSDRLTDVTGTRPANGFFARTGVNLTFTVSSVSRLQSRIPIISEDFDSEKRGLVPAPGDSDTIQHYLAGDGSWQDGYANFAGDHDLEEIEHRLSVLNTEIADGLGSIEFDSDSLLFAPIDFTDLDINAGNMIITLPADADTDMLDSEIAGVPTRDFNGTLTTNFTHYLNGVRTQIRVDLSGVSAVSRSGLVVTLTKRSNGAVRVYDEYYNPISIDINATDFGSGYFEQFELQSDYPFPPVILSTADFQRARTPATQHHAYRLITPNSVPVIDAHGRADFRAISDLGSLTVDNLAQGSNPPAANVTPRKDGVSYLRLANGILNRQTNAGQSIVSYTPYITPRTWQASNAGDNNSWSMGEFALDPTTGDLYTFRRTTSGLLSANPPLDSDFYWRHVGRESTLSPTELIGASQNPEVFTETGPATITGTDTGTFIQFSTTNAHVLTAYTIFYIRNASNVLQRAEVYPGTLTTPPASGRVALRTYTTTPLGNTGWTDSI